MTHPALTAPPTMLGSGGGMTNEQAMSVATKTAAGAAVGGVLSVMTGRAFLPGLVGGAAAGAALGLVMMPPKLTLEQRFGP